MSATSRLAHMHRRLRAQGLVRAVGAALAGRRQRWWSRCEFRMYRLDAAQIPPADAGHALRRDALTDLLLYAPFGSDDAPRREFLATARRRLADGQHVYTLAADGVLLHYAWLQTHVSRAGSDYGHEFHLPGAAAVLWDDYTRPDARGRGLQTASILRRLRDAAAAGCTSMLIGVRANNAESRHNIEKVGFGHWASGWAEYRLGHVRRWITAAPAGVVPLGDRMPMSHRASLLATVIAVGSFVATGMRRRVGRLVQPARPDRPPQGHDGWIELDVETAAVQFAERWASLTGAPGTPPTADPAWQRVYWRAFDHDAAPARVHALPTSDGVAAIVVARRAGRLLPRRASGVNGHTPYSALALDASPAVAGRTLDHLMASVQVLDLGPLYARAGVTGALVAAACERGLRVSRDAHGADAIIDLPESWNEFRHALSSKLAANTSRAARQLARLGALAVELVSGGAALQPVLTECFTLETLGWKGKGGVPMCSRPDTLQFYSDLATTWAAAGRLALYTLRLNGMLIAFEYCLRHNGRLDLLKLSYHPDFARYSPGNVLRFLLLEREIASGGAQSYHLGLMGEWKARWATRVEPLCRLRVYAPGVRGTAAYLAMSWLPRRARQQPVIRSTGRWLRRRLESVSASSP